MEVCVTFPRLFYLITSLSSPITLSQASFWPQSVCIECLTWPPRIFCPRRAVSAVLVLRESRSHGEGWRQVTEGKEINISICGVLFKIKKKKNVPLNRASYVLTTLLCGLAGKGTTISLLTTLRFMC